MNTKLTLTIEEKIIQRAKKYAKEKHSSLSGIVENYLRILTQEEKKENKKITPLVKSLQGSFKAPENFDYKKELKDRLADKYF